MDMNLHRGNIHIVFSSIVVSFFFSCSDWRRNFSSFLKQAAGIIIVFESYTVRDNICTFVHFFTLDSVKMTESIAKHKFEFVHSFLNPVSKFVWNPPKF